MKNLYILITLLLSFNITASFGEAIVIDVRTEAEWNQGHLSRAQRVNWEEIGSNISKLSPNKEDQIVLYCRSGNRAGRAMKILNELGYQDVINAGGLKSAQELLQDNIIK